MDQDIPKDWKVLQYCFREEFQRAKFCAL